MLTQFTIIAWSKLKTSPSKRKPFISLFTSVVSFAKVYELMEDRSKAELDSSLRKLKGCENVKQVTIDLYPTFKSIIKTYFSNAATVADRFHVKKLFSKRLNKLTKAITGDAGKNPIRTLILPSTGERRS
ncbi:MAG: hypothetical protein EOP10_01245 [Proteobacteria bacterium]|nr:MAG: hypothetical protein EOP10_01245 [Pseudomonadota bacterium]